MSRLLGVSLWRAPVRTDITSDHRLLQVQTGGIVLLILLGDDGAQRKARRAAGVSLGGRSLKAEVRFLARLTEITAGFRCIFTAEHVTSPRLTESGALCCETARCIQQPNRKCLFLLAHRRVYIAAVKVRLIFDAGMRNSATVGLLMRKKHILM